MTRHYRPVALVVLDGWGLSDRSDGNAVALADTPVFDRIVREYPTGSLRTSGNDVGLPDGQMGNSEVGHLNLGAGFVVDQDLKRISDAVRDGGLAENAVLRSVMERTVRDGSALHLMGLVGDGGVHAHTEHLLALAAMASDVGAERLYVHAFTDGRDTPPDSGLGFMQVVTDGLAAAGVGRVASVSGRYYAMDRDRRWARTERAWRAIDGTVERRAPSARDAVARAYEEGFTDEFIPPTVITGDGTEPVGRPGPGDGVILFNFRADRMRQLLAVLTDPAFDAFDPGLPDGLQVATLTEVARGQTAPIAFPPNDVEWPIARVISERGLRQYHTAETEKYAHVTYFFNGGREEPFPGEDRHMVPSPDVATYDLQPEMSAQAVTDALVARIHEGLDDFLIVNFANPDMVGHTGDLSAAARAVATVDRCLGRVLEALEAVGGVALVTADHGNAETMVDPVSGGPHTAHTMGRVPVVVVGSDFRAASPVALPEGRLSDVAPTLLQLMGLPAPPSMTGHSLLGGSRPKR